MAADNVARGLALRAERAASQPSPDVSNFSGAGMLKWRRAMARVRSGEANAKLAFIGDSTTEGVGTTLRTQAFPQVVSTILTGQGLPASRTSIFGAGRTGAEATVSAFNARNPEVVLGSGWQVFNQPFSLGGSMFTNATNTNPITVTHAGIDTFDVYYERGSGYGTFDLAIDAGAATTVNANAAASVAMATISGVTAGTHALTIARVSGGTVNIIGIVARNSAVKTVDCLNMGCGSTTTQHWVDGAHAARPVLALPVVAPDMTFINLGINDRTPSYGPISLTAYRANLQALITAAKLTGDCALVVPIPSASSRQALAIQAQYNAVIESLGLLNGCPVLNMVDRWTSFDTVNGLGFMSDVVHGTASGYAEEAQAHARLLLA